MGLRQPHNACHDEQCRHDIKQPRAPPLPLPLLGTDGLVVCPARREEPPPKLRERAREDRDVLPRRAGAIVRRARGKDGPADALLEFRVVRVRRPVTHAERPRFACDDGLDELYGVVDLHFFAVDDRCVSGCGVGAY